LEQCSDLFDQYFFRLHIHITGFVAFQQLLHFQLVAINWTVGFLQKVRLKLNFLSTNGQHADMLHRTFGFDDGGCHGRTGLVYPDIIFHCEAGNGFVLVAPNKQVYPFREVARMHTLFVICSGSLALEPVLMDQHNVEGVFWWVRKCYLLPFEEP